MQAKDDVIQTLLPDNTAHADSFNRGTRLEVVEVVQDINYFPGLFTPDESDALLERIMAATPWRQETIKIRGIERVQPRLTAWYGDDGAAYTYSHLRLEPLPWTRELRLIQERVERIAGARFNGVLLNYYRDGQDSISWHTDAPEHTVASVNFGAARRFDLKPSRRSSLGKAGDELQGNNLQGNNLQGSEREENGQREDEQRDSDKHSLLLCHGSLLLMAGESQSRWVHQVPKTTKPVGPRLNLTFRAIESDQLPAQSREV